MVLVAVADFHLALIETIKAQLGNAWSQQPGETQSDTLRAGLSLVM